MNEDFNAGLNDLTKIVAQTEAAPVTVKKAEKKYRIIVSEQENELNYVPVSVDGKVYQIMRGVEVVVPFSVVHILNNSKATRYVKEQQPDGRFVNVPREFLTVPYTVLGEA